MKVTYKIRTGMGTLLNPTFRCVEHIVTEFCDNLVEMGNSSLLYMMRGGYVHHTIDRDMIVKIEK